MKLTIIAESPVNPTEDEGKVERALRNIFPVGHMERINAGEQLIRLRITGNSLEDLNKLRNLIKQERIRSAARSMILGRSRGNTIHFHLNKQAAFAGRVSFCEPVGESPNGPISVEINSENPDLVVDYLATRPGDFSRSRSQDDN